MFVLRFDGGCRGSGDAGSGAWATHPDGSVVFDGSWYLGNRGMTNNIAEYTALVRGLETLLENVPNYGRLPLRIEGDSQLVVEQVAGHWATRAPQLVGLRNQARHLISQWRYPVEIAHIYRDRNTRADALANEAMDTREDVVRLAKVERPYDSI